MQRVQATPKGRRVLEAGRAIAPAELAALEAAAAILERLLGRPAPPLPQTEPET